MNSDIIDELFRKYYNDALLYTISLTKNQTIAEDIVSNAFFKALSSSDDTIRNFKPWLLTVCRNEYISLLRTNSRFVDYELSEDISDDKESVIDKLIKYDEYKLLYKALDKLKPDQREIITLFYFNRLSINDISNTTGKSISNIKILLYRGREKLKQIMEDD